MFNTFAVFALSNEWFEELFCEQCGSNLWCHITKHSPDQYSVRWAPQHLWEQVAHVDPSVAIQPRANTPASKPAGTNKNGWMGNAFKVDKSADTNQQTVGCPL